MPQQIISRSGLSHHVAAHTNISISGACMNTSRTFWDEDALDFRPTRWFRPDGAFVQPRRSSFIPWSAGPRICPGQKMAEVEFVAVMMTVFRSWKVRPVVFHGETAEKARDRLSSVVADSQPVATLQMNRPSDAILRWEELDRAQ